MPQEPLHVHVAPGLDEASMTLLRPHLDPAIRLTSGTVPPRPAAYQVLVCGRPSPDLLDASARLATVVVPFAGIPEVTLQQLRQRPSLALHNLHHNAAAAAEMAVALLLAAAKRIVPCDRALRSGDWTPRYDDRGTPLLEGRTALVLGLGAIGSRVARMTHGLGMQVVAVRRRSQLGAAGTPADVRTIAELPHLLPRADALLLCLPLTEQTRGLVGRRELALLPAHAVLVNVGRADVLDEAALYELLAHRRTLAAGLDVWWRYPDEAGRRSTPPSNYPFQTLDNVVMSPHRSGHVQETEACRMRHLADLLDAIARGQEPPNRVDLSAGY